MATTNVKAYGVTEPTAPMAPLEIPRRALNPEDLYIEIQFCGVCHSDLHTARNEWKHTKYPCVPGHEIVGRVTAVGDAVTKFKVGDTAGVGCMVDSCKECAACAQGDEQYCHKGFVGTYNGGPDNTYGGYSKAIVVKESFALRITHDAKDLSSVAPLLCAGITLYSPLKHWKCGPGKKVGIVGLGGLGHMGVKLAHALGAEVVLFTTSPSKIEDGKRLGASQVIVSSDSAQMATIAGQLDLIIDTVAVSHSLDPFLASLRQDGTLVTVGAPEDPNPAIHPFSLIMMRRSLAGSLIGGVRETQEMLDFCAEKNIVSDSEVIKMDYINEAYTRMLKSDVKYRFVIDVSTL